MIILGPNERHPDNSANAGTSIEEWTESFQHAVESSLPLTELTERHGRGADKLLRMTQYDGPFQGNPKLADLAQRYAEKSKAAESTSREIGHITARLLGISEDELKDLKEIDDAEKVDR